MYPSRGCGSPDHVKCNSPNGWILFLWIAAAILAALSRVGCVELGRCTILILKIWNEEIDKVTTKRLLGVLGKNVGIIALREEGQGQIVQDRPSAQAKLFRKVEGCLGGRFRVDQLGEEEIAEGLSVGECEDGRLGQGRSEQGHVVSRGNAYLIFVHFLLLCPSSSSCR